MKVLFIDRDGVINQESPTYIKRPDEWFPIPGSLEAIAKAARAGFHVVVVTNQSGVGRGLFDLDTLHTIHQTMIDAAKQVGGRIDSIVFCPHRPEDDCACRKPKPGLLEEVAARLNIDLSRSYVIGDRDADLEAAAAVGAHRILVRTGHGRDTEARLPPNARDVTVCDDLQAAVEHLVAGLEA